MQAEQALAWKKTAWKETCTHMSDPPQEETNHFMAAPCAAAPYSSRQRRHAIASPYSPFTSHPCPPAHAGPPPLAWHSRPMAHAYCALALAAFCCCSARACSRLALLRLTSGTVSATTVMTAMNAWGT